MSALLTPGDVAALIGRNDVVILDVRSGPDGAGRAAYEAGHIPGARHTDYAADGWRQKIGNVPGLLPDAAHLSALFARLGLTSGLRIVVVPEGRSANDFAAASRIYWTLRVAGHRPIGLLDGGTARWLAEGRAIETGPPVHTPSDPVPVSIDPSLRAVAGAVLEALAQGQALVDGRSQSYFRGAEKAEQSKEAGHIPGAVNIDYVSAFDAAAGRLKPLEQLRQIYGAVATGPVVSYCNTGHTAALNWFVLSELLGRDVRLYDGSMTDWTQDESRPVARVTD